MTSMLLTQYQGKIVGPVAWVLGKLMNAIFTFLYKIGIPNIGLSIIIFTLVIYICLLPLTYKQQKFSKLQSKMSPELQAIQAKYKGKKDNDSMMAMQQETKELYAKYGVSQTGSCVQLLIQMPILFALYRVIYTIPGYVTIVKDAFSDLVNQLVNTTGAAEFIQSLSSAKAYAKQFTDEAFVSGDTEFIKNTFIDVLNKCSSAEWNSLSAQFPDLSGIIEKTHQTLNQYNNFLGINIGETPLFMIQTGFAEKNFGLMFGGVIVPFLAAFTQWVNVKLMPQPANNQKPDADDPTAQMQQSMKTMNLMMPIMSAFFCLSLPAGLGLYWIAGAVIRSIQQVVINKHIDSIDMDAEIAKNTAKYKEKMEKMKTTPSMNRYANLSTRSTTLTSNLTDSKMTEEEKEKQMKKAMDIYQGKQIRKDSLLAKANMVKEFNENNKQS